VKKIVSLHLVLNLRALESCDWMSRLQSIGYSTSRICKVNVFAIVKIGDDFE